MSDIADNAEAEIEANLNIALALQRRSGTLVAPEGWDGETCVDCGETVRPVARLKLGYFTCIDCQSERERFRR